jgi:ribonuclease HI/ADP-ribose pyrophosphatase YjhB (NUDIX family)
MKQRVVVQAVIKNTKGEILLLRRANGMPSLIGQYELPGGLLHDEEQLEDALRRNIKNDTNLILESYVIKDALSMKDREDTDIQHVFVVYETTLKDNNLDNLKPQGSYDDFKFIKMNDLKQYNLRDSASAILNVLTADREGLVQPQITQSTKYVLYSDGGSRGNPGPSAAGFVIVDSESDQVIEEGGVYLGITTNNQAEYHGLRLGIERAIEKGILALECRLDSQLVVNQLNGNYHIKNQELWPIYERVKSYIPQFEKIMFVYIPREYNQRADAVVNRLLDQHQDDTL